MADNPNPFPSTSIEEQKLAFEAQRIEIDRQRAKTEASFFHKNAIALLSAAISLAAVVVGVAQVVNTSVQENLKLQQSTQLEREKLRLAAIDGDQRARIEIAKFVTDYRTQIFDGTMTERAAMREFMRQIFPEGLIVSALNAAEAQAAKSGASRPRPTPGGTPKPPNPASSARASSQSPAAVSYNLSGAWICTKYCPAGGEGKDARIDQDGIALVFTNEGGGVSRGYFFVLLSSAIAAFVPLPGEAVAVIAALPGAFTLVITTFKPDARSQWWWAKWSKLDEVIGSLRYEGKSESDAHKEWNKFIRGHESKYPGLGTPPPGAIA